MFRRRPRPVAELPLDDDDVAAIFAALWDIQMTLLDIVRMLGGEEEDEEGTDEP